MSTTDDYYKKIERIKLLEKKIELQEGLPFRYARKKYLWQREFLNSDSRNLFLTAANQIGKSTVSWERMLEFAYDKDKWASRWSTRPWTFWYLYPSLQVATSELEEKIIPTLLPKGKYERDPHYGWKIEYRNKVAQAIHLNVGVTILMRSYASDLKNLQTGTAWYVAADEEIPWEIYPEINMRRSATAGYYSMVFTATMGQQEWYETMEIRGKGERFPDAHKMQISLFDCQQFEDGSPSHWSKERIQQTINSCGSDAEVKRRVYGRFVKESGKKYQSFSRLRNLSSPTKVHEDWHWYAGVDPGSGGEGHPAAITLVAVSPDYRRGRIVKVWRGGKNENTTASDVLQKFKELGRGINFSGLYYDWADKDFEVFAQRDGIPFQKAEKSHEIGVSLLNSLFKNQMLSIDDTPENSVLVEELDNLLVGTRKTKAKDDAIDSARYAITKIPWDLTAITGNELIVLPKNQVDHVYTTDELRAMAMVEIPDDDWGMSAEIAEWNELYEP